MKIKQIRIQEDWDKYVIDFKKALDIDTDQALDVTKYNSNKQTIFHELIRGEDEKDFIKLLEKYPIPGTTSIEQEDSQIGYNTKNKSGFTPLHIAVDSGKNKVVGKLLAQKDIKVNEQNSKGKTPLHLAVIRGNTELVKKLLERKDIELNLQDNGGMTPLHYAVDIGKNKVVGKLLAQKDIKVNEQNSEGKTPLHLAVISGNTELVKKLLERKDIELNFHDKGGMTPLHHAVENGHADIVKLLLDQKGIKVNVKNSNSQIAKELSGENEQIESLFILRELNDKNAKNKMLLAAVEKGHWLVVEKLLDKRVNEVPNAQLKTILIKAIEAGQVDVVKLYLSSAETQKQGLFARLFGSNPMSQMTDRKGETLLHHAAKSGNKEITEMLLDADKKIAKKGIFSGLFGSKSIMLNVDTKGKTALDYAYENKNWDIAKTLLSNGIKTNQPEALLTSAVKDGKAELVDLILEKFDTRALYFIDDHGKTALDYACEHGKWNIFKNLLNKGFEVNKQENILISAVKAGQSDIVTLVFKKLDPEALGLPDDSGKTALDHACENKEWGIARYLLNKGVKTKEPHTLLISAVKARDSKLAKLLLAKFDSQDMNIVDNDGKTALDYACENNDWDIAKDLLENNITTKDRKTLLISAVKAGEGELVKTLLAKFDSQDMNVVDNDGKTALDYACENNDWDIAKDLLNNRISTNNHQILLFLAMKAQKTDIIEEMFTRFEKDKLSIVDENGATILHHAVNFGHKNVVEKILEIEKNSKEKGIFSFFKRSESIIAKVDKNGLSALDYAGKTKNWALVEYLLENQAKCRNPQDILMSAAKDGQDKVITLLLSNTEGFNPNLLDKEGNTALYYALKNGHTKAVKAMLESKTIDPKIADDEGSTALHHAAYFNNVEIVDLLLNKGASINIQDKNGATPLHDAIRNGNINAAEKLLAWKDIDININKKDNDGMTPLHYAVHYAKKDLLNTLLARGANPNIADNFRNTPLRNAILDGKFDIAKAILGNPSIEPEKPIDGKTLLQLVVEANNQSKDEKDKEKTLEVIKLLVEAGYDPEHKIKVDGEETTLLSQVKDKETKKFLEEVINAAKDVSIDDLKKDSETSKDKKSKAIKDSIKEVEEYNKKYRITKFLIKPVEVTKEAKVSFAAKVLSSRHTSQGQSKGRGE